MVMSWIFEYFISMLLWLHVLCLCMHDLCIIYYDTHYIIKFIFDSFNFFSDWSLSIILDHRDFPWWDCDRSPTVDILNNLTNLSMPHLKSHDPISFCSIWLQGWGHSLGSGFQTDHFLLQMFNRVEDTRCHTSDLYGPNLFSWLIIPANDPTRLHISGILSHCSNSPYQPNFFNFHYLPFTTGEYRYNY